MHLCGGTRAHVDQLNIPKFTPDYISVPQHDFIKAFHDEIGPFHRKVWDQVIRKLFVLFAIILQLPENYFVDRHNYDQPSEDHLRYVSHSSLRSLYLKLSLDDISSSVG